MDNCQQWLILYELYDCMMHCCTVICCNFHNLAGNIKECQYGIINKGLTQESKSAFIAMHYSYNQIADVAL